MSRIIKTVSLDAKSDKIASQKPNFSAWVRNQLILEDETFQNSHVTLKIFREKGICNPSASPRCNICYPNGRPSLKNIRLYNGNKITAQELQSRTKIEAPAAAIVKVEEKEPLPPPMIVKSERKYLRRLLKLVWSFI